MATPFLVPNHPGAPGALTRPRPNPVEAYLARLGPGSRRGQRQALNAIAGFLSDGVLDAEETDWASIRYQDTSAVRSWLVKRYAPNTARRLLAALRGVLKECWRMGLMQVPGGGHGHPRRWWRRRSAYRLGPVFHAPGQGSAR